jgi:hypothetical protein
MAHGNGNPHRELGRHELKHRFNKLIKKKDQENGST